MPSILAVEDNPTIQVLLRNLAAHCHVDIDLVSTGAQALDHIKHNSYRLVLMDWHLPDMTGLECTTFIREREKDSQSRIPVIALTARAMAEDKNECLSAGMDDFLSKPFSMQDFQELMTKWAVPGN